MNLKLGFLHIKSYISSRRSVPYNMLVVVYKSCHELNYNKQKNDVASFNKASVLQYVCICQQILNDILPSNNFHI
jgi:hypothetical protein